ncbi:MAG: hypothetical protein ACQCXQ_09460 [Verrucomicrobiales bacterium]|nr:hypothetical protein [Verrucomicrobiota bacterium JB025]
MTRTTPLTRKNLPAGHVIVPTAAISGMSLALAAGLKLTGVIAKTNAEIARLFSRQGTESYPNQLPAWAPWIAAALLSVALAAAILEVPATWRRVVLWLSTSFLVFAWAPVLSLAAFEPDISEPWIATFWSGACALVYASKHRMAIDQNRRRHP